MLLPNKVVFTLSPGVYLAVQSIRLLIEPAACDALRGMQLVFVALWLGFVSRVPGQILTTWQ
jgi:hypothetical protein